MRESYNQIIFKDKKDVETMKELFFTDGEIDWEKVNPTPAKIKKDTMKANKWRDENWGTPQKATETFVYNTMVTFVNYSGALSKNMLDIIAEKVSSDFTYLWSQPCDNGVAAFYQYKNGELVYENEGDDVEVCRIIADFAGAEEAIINTKTGEIKSLTRTLADEEMTGDEVFETHDLVSAIYDDKYSQIIKNQEVLTFIEQTKSW